ncbi:RSP_2648 family PIN domain-containing protein [Tropicimonas sp. S265A]|uniref:RSP_2648 family PIN domain-containing protein n=1 Tax=Tropicimonas sp. S265A TaxID=3415134 RepID=UPI003C7ADA22
MSERVLLDACVLYPTLLRGILTDAADAGFFTPLWSPRILDEWRHAASRAGAVEAALTDGEISRLSARHPQACITPDPDLCKTLFLPDPNDTHVLAAAITAQADSLLTLNLKDFPTRTLGHHGLIRREPDTFLLELRAAHTQDMRHILTDAAMRAVQAIGGDATPRSVFKRARLPRLGKAIFG